MRDSRHRALTARFYEGCRILALGVGTFFFRLKVEGLEHVPPRNGLILASNHTSYVDPVMIGVAVERELFYVTKQEVFPIPLLGRLIRKLNALPIDRSRGDRGGLLAIEKRLKSGGALIIFPEGTRNKTGRAMTPKPGVGMMIYRTVVPVVPVYISGTANIWKSLIGLSRVVVRFGEPIWFHPDRLPATKKEAYQSISCEVMQKIGALKQRTRNAGPAVPAS